MANTYGHLKPNTPFSAVFPNSLVPLKSIEPLIPRDYGCPPCFDVDADRLTAEQIQQLAQMLYEQWQPECESIEQALDYIREPGLPLKCEWFTVVSTDDWEQFPPDSVVHQVLVAFEHLEGVVSPALLVNLNPAYQPEKSGQ